MPGCTAPKTTYNVLCVDTSTDMLACGLGWFELDQEGRPSKVGMSAVADHLCRRQANQSLVPTIDRMLSEAGLGRSDVDAVLTGRGPGSFTGVRIGVATAKGLACGLDVPLHGTSTLDAVAWRAWGAGARGLVCVIADAMRREVYPGLYRIDDDGPERMFATESVCKVPEAIATLADRTDPAQVILTGDGLLKYRDAFEAAGFSAFADPGLWYPSSEGLLRASLSPARWDGGESGHPAEVLPVYTRLSDAEENERIRLGRTTPRNAPLTGVADALGGIHLQQRPMGINDLEAVAELELRAFGQASEHAVWSREMFQEEYEAPGRIWWVIHDQGTIIGFAGGRVIDGDLEILDVAVDPDHRRQGLAQRLMARLTYDAQMLGATTTSLEVAVDNDPAFALYERMGYAIAGRRRNYYGPGNDAYVMTACLPLDIEAEKDEPAPKPACGAWPLAHAADDAHRRAVLQEAGELILAIESSCDETAVAIIDGAGRIRANVISTQIDFHARFGGVVPEIASRKHTEAIVGVYLQAMEDAAADLGIDVLEPTDLAAVAVTQGPGLVGALVVGLAFGKALAWSADRPLVCVNHLEGHLFANKLQTPDLEPPFVAGLISGGHTMLVHVRAWDDYVILGSTLDDAVGEAFDKVAKALGLGYPGGPVISRLAKDGNPKAIDFPRAMLHSHDYRFSLSGLKTAVITYIEDNARAGRAVNVADLAASFEAAVIEVQVKKAIAAVKETHVRDFCAGGGVTANPELRAAYTREFAKRGVRVTLPPTSACTDNAAMIALVARHRFDQGLTDPLDSDADPNLSLGGIR